MIWWNRFVIYYLFNNILVSLLSIFISYIIIYKHSLLPSLVLYMTSVRIRSCTKDPSHEFFVDKLFVHSQFVDLDNLF